MKLQKSTAFVGCTPKGCLPLATKNQPVRTNRSHADIIKKARADKRTTTKIMGNCIYMFVLYVSPLVNPTPTHKKTVRGQKITWALLKRSAKFKDVWKFKFKDRLVFSNTVNNGQSLNWKHDWFKFNNKSYCEVLKSVCTNKRDQVDNYPWQSSVSKGGGVNMRSTNRDKLCSKTRVMKSQQRPKGDPNINSMSDPSRVVNSINQHVAVRNKAKFHTTNKVENIVSTQSKVAGNHEVCASQNNAFTPLTCDNRF